jgi:rhamnogalacturonan endolyase
MGKRIIIFLLPGLLLIGCAQKQQQKPFIAYENIDRGVVALQINETHVYIGWRLMKDDPIDAGFNIYRKQVGLKDFMKVNGPPVTATTDFVDSTVKIGQSYRYRVKKVSGGSEVENSSEGSVFIAGQAEFDMKGASLKLLNRPYYSMKLKDEIVANKVAIADLDGDGAYEYIIQSPSFNVDPYYRLGYWKRSPETFKIDAYTAKGKFMWRYDMGWAIETGTWYSPFVVYDVDGDGCAELYAKAGEGDPREMDGHVLEGPEYLIKIDGKSGQIVSKINWLSKEGCEDYNAWSRNFMTVAYLDGQTPSLIMQRGTYSVIKTEALSNKLEKEWYFESTGENSRLGGQGGHTIQVADINLDGKDELVLGTFALDSKGKLMWSLGLGHNDGMHLGDINPAHPGVEIFYNIETSQPKNGVCLVDALTGEILWGYNGKTVHVHNGGMAADIDPEYPGMECYAGEAKGGSQQFLYSCEGKRLSDKSLGSLSPFPVWWDNDDLKELVVGNNLFKYKGDTIQKIEGRVVMVADLTGDWREEIVTALPGELRIYSTNIPANNRKVCLMQNRQYRLGVVNSTMGYFDPPMIGIEPKK